MRNVPKTTVIQISPGLKMALRAKKLHPRETYAQVIDRLLEDSEELSPKTLRSIVKARREFAQGNYVTHERLKRELGL